MIVARSGAFSILAGAISLLTAGCVALPETNDAAAAYTAPMSSTQDAQLRTELEAQVARKVVPGAVVYIASGDDIVVHETVGSAAPEGEVPLAR